MKVKVFQSFRDVSSTSWNDLDGICLFTSHEFLSAMEESGCAVPATGWKVQILTVWENEILTGGMVVYFKTHSYGEFVFDWAWADAYRQSGLSYYPKLISAIPFSPIAGRRLLAKSAEIRKVLIQSALGLAKNAGASSFHCLFPAPSELEEWKTQGLALRQSVQFHWENRNYVNFVEFTAQLRHDKRKKINQERRKIREAGITFQHLRGSDCSREHWEFFMQCYQNTHEQYGSPMALNLDFFLRLHALKPDSMLLVIALKEGKKIASAFNLIDGHALYGRSWGALEAQPALHFETCYYQAIDFCIQNKFLLFEGGAQGEHKVARGFLPVTTWSAHWLEHPEFFRAVEDFLARESGAVENYKSELDESSPFKK